MIRLRALAVILGFLAWVPPAEAQRNCRKGKPCGNTCIARDKVCRIESPGPVGRGAPTDREPAARRVPLAPSAQVSPRPVGPTMSCVIARVVDGDTVHCAGALRVRLILIDAHESDQVPYGALATRALRGLVPEGTRVTLELDVQRYDRYGRLLAYVYAPDGPMANEEMVRHGYAHLSTYPPNVQHVEASAPLMGVVGGSAPGADRRER